MSSVSSQSALFAASVLLASLLGGCDKLPLPPWGGIERDASPREDTSPGYGGAGGTDGPDKGSRAVCEKYRTVKQMDDFFRLRCGGTLSACHTSVLFGDFSKEDVYKRIVDAQTINCPGTFLADTTDYRRGGIWVKTQSSMPVCSSGPSIGRQAGAGMPTPFPGEPPRPLSEEERTCLENYLKALED